MYIKHFYAGHSQMYNYNEYGLVYLVKEIGITDQVRIYKRFKWVRKKEVLSLYCRAGEIYRKKVDVSLKNMFLRIYFMGGGWIIFVK